MPRRHVRLSLEYLDKAIRWQIHHVQVAKDTIALFWSETIIKMGGVEAALSKIQKSL